MFRWEVVQKVVVISSTPMSPSMKQSNLILFSSPFFYRFPSELSFICRNVVKSRDEAG